LKPLIVGMNNPVTPGRDEFALWPDPPGCAGWRLWKMLEQETGATKRDYLRAFDRVNLCNGDWNMEQARSKMLQLTANRDGRRIVLLGNDVWRAYSLNPPPKPFTWRDGVALFPHPSGRNRMYYDPAVYLCAVYFLAELYEETKRDRKDRTTAGDQDVSGDGTASKSGEQAQGGDSSGA
jgi:hypothetical protein